MKEECVCVCNVHGTNKTSARSRYLLSMDNRKNVLRKKKKRKKDKEKKNEFNFVNDKGQNI